MTEAQVEAILRRLILDKKLNAKINQIGRILIVDSSVDTARYADIHRWSKSLDSILQACSLSAK